MVTKALKPLIIFLLICYITVGYSQSVVQKYNSLYNRYEYFDDSGNMIGYKTYNSLLKQWEFYSSDNSTRKTDFGKYISPIDLKLVSSTLRNRQARYDANRETVMNYVIDLGNKIWDMYDSEEEGENAALKFYKKVENSHIFRDVDFSNASYFNRAISQIKSMYYGSQ